MYLELHPTDLPEGVGPATCKTSDLPLLTRMMARRASAVRILFGTNDSPAIVTVLGTNLPWPEGVQGAIGGGVERWLKGRFDTDFGKRNPEHVT